jgi:hypothetical protein
MVKCIVIYGNMYYYIWQPPLPFLFGPPLNDSDTVKSTQQIWPQNLVGSYLTHFSMDLHDLFFPEIVGSRAILRLLKNPRKPVQTPCYVLPVPSHLGSLEPIIYIIKNDRIYRGTKFSLSGLDFGNIVKFGKRFGA